ncbi:hypothetical protein FBEOM_4525 [Fusarium beomiforme]|uniref:Uncharacterized protein n=1 Tax=Fusarium beomiforme TaxID=44412 RepID=A0A9P5E0Z5_9HYPO|nr:hypothetical protein FBEOM_4525 [Fusarium beomiforme]
MPSFRFENLPTEMKKNIILQALPTVIAPHQFTQQFGVLSFYEPSDQRALASILESTSEIKILGNTIRCLTAVSTGTGQPVTTGTNREAFRLDPFNDWYKAVDMRLPAIRASPAWNPSAIAGHHRNALPLLNVVSFSKRPYLGRGRAEPVTAGPSTALPPPFQTQSYYKMELGMDLPIFSRLPKVKNLALIVQTLEFKWHIEGCRLYGPAVVGRRPCVSHWGRHRPGTPIQPFADFQGYSPGCISLGSTCVGFRVWPEFNFAEFSHLSYSEVEKLMDNHHSAHGSDYSGLHPMFIALVWVVRSEKDLEPTQKPHHEWIEVRQPRSDDPEWVEKAAMAWKMTRHMLSHGRNGTSINEEGSDENLVPDPYCFKMQP